jgi:formylglycine-generating enzyme required for sulfatase activity
VYAFPHLTFEEYLAARYLVRPNFGKTAFELVQKSERWREAVILLGEHLCFAQGDQERMVTLLNALTPERLPTDKNTPVWRAVWYAGDLLLLYRRAFPSETFPREKVIAKGLYKLVTIGALSPRERASAADTLDELGYIPDELYKFIPVPNAKSSNFYISKYPVANAQYERFLKPENFQNKDLWVDFPKYDKNGKDMNETWGEEPWEWLQEALQDKDYEVQDGVLLPRYWRDPRFGVNRRHAPVVGVTWYEASAYCKWLAAQRDLPEWKYLETFNVQPSTSIFRLPTEIEWSLAAGGEENNRFAFGGLKNPAKEITAYANTLESGINRTTPVWMYPQGASPTGAMDMSGNVWEWQANYSGLEYRGEKTVGLRGGSWDGSVGFARVSFRSSYLPLYRYNYIGFRMVAAPLPNG